MSGMRGWLVVNGFLHRKKFDELTALFCESAKRQGIALDVKKNSELITPFEGIPDFVLFWDKDILLAQRLECAGVRVCNQSQAIRICDDKRQTHLALERAGLPVPETIFAPMTYANIGFTDWDFLIRAEETLGFPMVVKEAYGSFGEQVWLAHDRNQLVDIVRRCSATEILFQQFIAESRGKDIRLQVVGGRVIGAMYRYSDKDFRANISSGGHMRAYEPSEEECALSVRAAQAVGADFAGVDLLFGRDGPIVCEVNSNAHFKNLMDCTGVNTADAIFAHIKNAT